MTLILVALGLAALFVALSLSANAALYRPEAPLSMWDTWLFKDGDEHHLFFLQSEGERRWSSIGRAVSRDLVHWEALPSIPVTGPEGAWDHGPALTGCTVKREGLYYMFYGCAEHGQQIGVMTSPDLEHWTKQPDNPLLKPEPPHYCGDDWRDLCAVWRADEDRWRGYLCAQTPGPAGAPAACIARLASKDLIQWDQLSPAFASDRFVDMEVPDYFELNGRHYLLFSSLRSRMDVGGKTNASGTFYVMGEAADGPYWLPENPLLLGAGRGRFENYVGRTISHEGGRLLYHHTVKGDVLWGLPKWVRQDASGALCLRYWDGPALLETGVACEGDIGEAVVPSTNWKVENGCASSATQAVSPSILWFEKSPPDANIGCTLELGKDAAAGLALRWDGGSGVGIVVDAGAQTACLASMEGPEEALKLQTLDDVRVDLDERAHCLRVFLRAHRCEVFLDDRWLLGASIHDYPLDGGLGLLALHGGPRFSGFRTAAIEPLA